MTKPRGVFLTFVITIVERAVCRGLVLLVARLRTQVRQ